MTKNELSVRIQGRLQDIPASNGGYISVAPETLRSVLSRDLLERICDEAADEAMRALGGSRPATREQMERAGLAEPGQSHCSERENDCEQDEGA